MSLEHLLQWDSRKGIGYFPVQGNPYNEEYFCKYEKYAETPMGLALTKARISLIERHARNEPLVDIGIGCGQFVRERGTQAPTFGYDVNPYAIQWLLSRGAWFDPYFQDPDNASCFDSLEHMSRPEHFVQRVKRHLFVSIPVFQDRAHVLRSKHFRPDEHYHYFTSDGFQHWMADLGFVLLEENFMEVELGREDIRSFAFRRVNVV